MRKSIVCILATVSAFANVAAAKCQLDQPLFLGQRKVLETDQQKMIHLEHVVFDKPYKTKVIPPLSSISNLEMKLFEITWSLDPYGTQKPTGWAGAWFGPAGSIDSAGFSFQYGGNFDFEGTTDTTDGVTTYATQERSKLEAGDPRTSLSITVQGNYLAGLELTIPVRDKIEEQGIISTPYLGENETLCLKSAIVTDP